MFGFQFFSFLTRLNGSCVKLSLGFFPKPVFGFTVRQLQKLIYYAYSKCYVLKNSLFSLHPTVSSQNGRKFQICPKLSKFLF